LAAVRDFQDYEPPERGGFETFEDWDEAQFADLVSEEETEEEEEE
jgi:hypothetical protein